MILFANTLIVTVVWFVSIEGVFSESLEPVFKKLNLRENSNLLELLEENVKNEYEMHKTHLPSCYNASICGKKIQVFEDNLPEIISHYFVRLPFFCYVFVEILFFSS